MASIVKKSPDKRTLVWTACMFLLLVLCHDQSTHSVDGWTIHSSNRAAAAQGLSTALFTLEQYSERQRKRLTSTVLYDAVDGIDQTTEESSTAQSNLISIENALHLHGKATFIDGSWYHKGDRNGRTEFIQGPRISGSIYFDLNDIAGDPHPTDEFSTDDSSSLPLSHMQPSPALWAAAMDAYGIAPTDPIVIYGHTGAVFLPRVWFSFAKVHGHMGPVRVLQGSVTDWIDAGGAVEDDKLLSVNSTEDSTMQSTRLIQASDLDVSQPARYQTDSIPGLMVDFWEMESVVEWHSFAAKDPSSPQPPLIVDTRGSSFAKGHMPGALHVPYSSLHVLGQPNVLRPVEELRSILSLSGVTMAPDTSKTESSDADDNNSSASAKNNDKDIVLTCGSGVSVCTIFLALDECGYDTTKVRVYDGSWQEWGALENTPKVVPEERYERKE